MAAVKTPVFQVDETSNLPIWVQLRNRLAYLIRKGDFKSGEQLPSVRSLAADANINYNTVTRAYRDLELGGLVISFRGRGMFVAETEDTEDAKLEAIDVTTQNCLRQYRDEGLSYSDIRTRILEIIDNCSEESLSSAQTRERFFNAD